MLKPNEKRKIIFILNDRDLACYDERLDQWVTLPGIYTIKIGFDSGNLPQSIELSVEGSVMTARAAGSCLNWIPITAISLKTRLLQRNSSVFLWSRAFWNRNRPAVPSS